MLTANQERYLATISDDQIAVIKPFDLKTKILAEELIRSIHDLFPELKILLMGSTGLEIAGQGDVDLYMLCNPRDFGKYLPDLKTRFGEPVKEKDLFIAWEFKKDGIPVEMYLTDPGDKLFNISMKEQMGIFYILKNDSKLLKEYEDLKLSMNGKPQKEYQRAKYEFYNRVLGLK